jgi:hypothetical protein
MKKEEEEEEEEGLSLKSFLKLPENKWYTILLILLVLVLFAMELASVCSQLKGKEKGRVLRCVGVEKDKITLRKVTKVGG